MLANENLTSKCETDEFMRINDDEFMSNKMEEFHYFILLLFCNIGVVMRMASYKLKKHITIQTQIQIARLLS